MPIRVKRNGQWVLISDSAVFIPAVDETGELSWTNNVGLENPVPVNIKGNPPIKGEDYYTEEEKETLQEEILDKFSAPTLIDFTDFSKGNFTEIIDGETITHIVTFDENHRPTSIDGCAIIWG